MPADLEAKLLTAAGAPNDDCTKAPPLRYKWNQPLILQLGLAALLLLNVVVVGLKLAQDGTPGLKSQDAMTFTQSAQGEETLPAGVAEGLKAYEELFTTMNPALLPKVFHKEMSMSWLNDENDLSSFTVLDYKSTEALTSMLYDVNTGKKPVSSLPESVRPFAHQRLFHALPPVKHYALSENVHVTLINDRTGKNGKQTASFFTNMHWINTPEGWRVKDKIYVDL